MENDQNHTFLEKFNLPFSVLWDKYKIFFIFCGLLVLVFKFRENLLDFLVASAHKTVNDATKKSEVLKQEEKQANDKSEDLRKQATDLGKNKPTIDEDWNKK